MLKPHHCSLRFLAIALFTLLLAACSGGKPEATLERFYTAAAKGDVEKATNEISFDNTPAEQMMQAKGKVQMIVGEMQNRINANDGLDKIEVVSSTIAEDGKSAKVQVKLVYKNGKSSTESSNLLKGDDGWKIKLR